MQTGTIAFLFGVLVVQLQPNLILSPWVASIWLVPLLLYRFRRSLAQVCIYLLAGYFFATMVAQYRLGNSLPAGLEGVDVGLVGEVVSLPERHEHHSSFLFAIEQLTFQGGPETHFPSLVRLNWYDDAPDLRPGQQWAFTARLKRPHGMMNPGGFDYEKWLFQQGIRATGYVRNRSPYRELAASSFHSPILRLRAELQRQLKSALAGDEFAGLIQALAIGERDAISDEQWKLLQDTGTNHLLAISGLHIGLVAGLVYFLVLRMWRYSSRACLWLAAPRAAAIVSLVVALVYAAMAGFSVPTQRALLMLVVVMGALILLRPVKPWRVLSLVLLAVVVHDPLVVLSAGFWLSFTAVALIFYGMGGRLKASGIWWRWGRVQWLVALGLSPLLLLMFGQAALVAPLANLIAVPLVGLLVVPLTLCGTLLLLFWHAAGVTLLHLAVWLLSLLWPLLHFLADTLPPLQQAAAPWWASLLALPGLVWLLAPKGWPMRWAGVVPLLPLLLWHPELPEHGKARFTLLDVGQGLASVVETRHHVLVFDTGPRFPSGFNTGEAVVLPFLRHYGISSIDTLIISHGDNDHIGGAHDVTGQYPVGRVLTSVPEKMGWIAHEDCHRGERWRWDGVWFEILHPARPSARERGNNDSCVLRVSAGGRTLLLTGDIEQGAERELVERYGERLHADILVAPHHGSKTSSSEPFLDAVRPKWVLFPVGYRNRYGFPHPTVWERYHRRGIGLLSSSSSGAIGLVVNEAAPVLSEYRKTARRYWHAEE